MACEATGSEIPVDLTGCHRATYAGCTRISLLSSCSDKPCLPPQAQARYPLTQGVNPWLVTVSVMLPTFMEVLDTAIASVALPYIAG